MSSLIFNGNISRTYFHLSIILAGELYDSVHSILIKQLHNFVSLFSYLDCDIEKYFESV